MSGSKHAPSPLRSMTGFARARRTLPESDGGGEIVISIKSVNHRGLDVHVRGPESVDVFETAIRAQVKSKVARGHVEVRVSLPGSVDGTGEPMLNRTLLESYIRAFQDAASTHGIDAKPDLNAALRVPGMFAAPDTAEPSESTGAVLAETLDDALGQMNRFREREGAEIAAEMRKHNAQVASIAVELEQIRSGALEAFQYRLDERLRELLKGAQIDPQRLAQEAAILADRSDIGEELARLRIHSAQLGALLDEGGEAGKKLDFLLQEMNRESNTVLSKTSGIGETGLRITELALAAKAAIEKIREQSLNLE